MRAPQTVGPVIAASVACAMAGCVDELTVGSGQPVAREVRVDEPARQVSMVDLVVVVDNAPGMGTHQVRLADAVRSFAQELARRAPSSSLRIIGVTTEVATADTACAVHGGQPRSIVVAQQPVFDVQPGDRDAVVSVLASVMQPGEDGCPYGQPLAALSRLPHSPVAELLRDGSHRALFLATDDDDCSAASDALWAGGDPDAAAVAYRCLSSGVVCQEPTNTTGIKTECRPGGDGLIDVNQLIAGVAAFDSIGVFAGPPGPVEVVEWGGGLELASACSNGRAVRPTPRLQYVAETLPAAELYRGNLCRSLPGQLAGFGEALGRRTSNAYCLGPGVVDRNGYRPGRQPDCRVELVDTVGAQELRECSDDGSQALCYRYVSGVCGADPDELAIELSGAPVGEPDVRVAVECTVLVN